MLRDDTDSVYMILAGVIGLLIVTVFLGLFSLHGHTEVHASDIQPSTPAYRVRAFSPPPMTQWVAPTSQPITDPNAVVVTRDDMYDPPAPVIRAANRAPAFDNQAFENRPARPAIALVRPAVSEMVYFLPAVLPMRPAVAARLAPFQGPAPTTFVAAPQTVSPPIQAPPGLLRIGPGSPISVAAVRPDTRGTGLDGMPVYGAVSGSRNVWLYQVTVYNGSPDTVWIVPGQLRFDDGSTEDLFAWSGKWDLIRNPEPGIPENRPFPFYTPDPEDSSSLALPPQQYTTFAVFAENSHNIRRDIDPATGAVTLTSGQRIPTSMVFMQSGEPISSRVVSPAPLVDRLTGAVHAIASQNGSGQKLEVDVPHGFKPGEVRL